jgi:hypothetical protein
MKSIVAGLAILAASAAYAEESKVETVNIPVHCVEGKMLEELMDKYNELPLARGVSSRVLGEQRFDNPMVVFINPEATTFTVVEQVSETHYCVIAMGAEFQPVPQEVIEGIVNRREKSKS